MAQALERFHHLLRLSLSQSGDRTPPHPSSDRVCCETSIPNALLVGTPRHRIKLFFLSGSTRFIQHCLFELSVLVDLSVDHLFGEFHKFHRRVAKPARRQHKSLQSLQVALHQDLVHWLRATSCCRILAVHHNLYQKTPSFADLRRPASTAESSRCPRARRPSAPVQIDPVGPSGGAFASKKNLRIDIVPKLNARNPDTAAVNIQLPMRCTPALLFPPLFRLPPDTVTDWNHPTMLRTCRESSSHCLAWQPIHVPCKSQHGPDHATLNISTLSPSSPQRCWSAPFLTTKSYLRCRSAWRPYRSPSLC